VDVFFGRPNRKLDTTSAFYSRIKIFWLDIFVHFSHLVALTLSRKNILSHTAPLVKTFFVFYKVKIVCRPKLWYNDNEVDYMDERQSLKVLPYLAALGTVLFWASAFAAVKFALDYFSAGSLMLLRFLVASVVLLIVCIIKRAGLPKLRDLPLFSICGVVGVFMYMWFFNMGTNMVAAGISGFIIASVPLFTLVFSIIFLKEKAKATMWIGVIISFLGIVIIAFTQITDLQLNAGVWLLLFAASLAGVFIITQRLLLRKYSVLQATAYPIAIATLFMMIFLPDLLKELPQASLTSIGIVAYLGVFPAALAYLLWGYALAKAKKTVHITSFLYLSPFLASLIAFIWLGEQMPVLAFVGGIVVVAGMVITNLFKNKKRP